MNDDAVILNGEVQSVEHRERWLAVFRNRVPCPEEGVSQFVWEPSPHGRFWESREDALREIEVEMRKSWAKGFRPDRTAVIRVVFPA